MTARATLDRRCPLCGRLYPASQRHVCAETGAATADGTEGEPLPSAVSHDDLVGAILGTRYEILERISRGGMGIVYKARHSVLQSLVAVKVLLHAQKEEAERRFLQEARLASKVNHPNTVHISDFGVLVDGRSYLVMEFLRGPTLGTILTHGRVDMVRACRIAVQIARGLTAVHDQGIVHRVLFALSRTAA